jgi:hypothetical protein
MFQRNRIARRIAALAVSAALSLGTVSFTLTAVLGGTPDAQVLSLKTRH